MATNYKTNGKESDRSITGYASKSREAKMDARSMAKKVNIGVKKKSVTPVPKSYGRKSPDMVGVTRGLGYKKK